MGIEEKIDRYLKEAKTKGVTLPKDVDKMSDKDIKQLIEKTAKLSDSKIEKNQDIVNKQMDKVHAYLNKNHGDEWKRGWIWN